MTTNFREELTHLINKHSIENVSNTPDFILAGYLHDCLSAFDKAITRREEWYTPSVIEVQKVDVKAGP